MTYYALGLYHHDTDNKGIAGNGPTDIPAR